MNLSTLDDLQKAKDDGLFTHLDWPRDTVIYEDGELQIVADGKKRTESVTIPKSVWEQDSEIRRLAKLRWSL